MRKVLFATLLGGFLGIFDGLTSLFTPEVRDQIVGIVIGSTSKGSSTGCHRSAFFARRVQSLALGISSSASLVGGFFAYLVPRCSGHMP